MKEMWASSDYIATGADDIELEQVTEEEGKEEEGSDTPLNHALFQI